MTPPRIDWRDITTRALRADWFDVAKDDFSNLEIRPANAHFSYFYNTARNQLVKQFLLHEGERVALLCEVRLAAKGDQYSPRVRLSKVEKATAQLASEVADGNDTRVVVKASVDTEGGHENFFNLVSFVLGLKGIAATNTKFRLADASDLKILSLVADRERGEIIPLVASLLNSKITERELGIISGRKQQLETFDRLLNDPEYFSAERTRLGKGPEALWQNFFETATWIFGYGLNFVSHDGIDSGKLERITTGASLWNGAGKRSDAVMRSRAVISTLLFCEIKRHDTPLLKAEAYRPPDVYVPSTELVGGVAQLQKTVRKAYRSFLEQIRNHTEEDGSPTGLDFSTTKARQVLIAGTLSEFRTENGVNGEQMESFELFRKSHADIEVITFDELFARAKFIVED